MVLIMLPTNDIHSAAQHPHLAPPNHHAGCYGGGGGMVKLNHPTQAGNYCRCLGRSTTEH